MSTPPPPFPHHPPSLPSFRFLHMVSYAPASWRRWPKITLGVPWLESGDQELLFAKDKRYATSEDQVCEGKGGGCGGGRDGSLGAPVMLSGNQSVIIRRVYSCCFCIVSSTVVCLSVCLSVCLPTSIVLVRLAVVDNDWLLWMRLQAAFALCKHLMDHHIHVVRVL